MCQQEGTVGFTVFILMKECHFLERRVRKAERKYFATTTEGNQKSARKDSKSAKNQAEARLKSYVQQAKISGAAV